MNADRRKLLDKAINALGEAKEAIDTVKNQEQESFDNLNENLQQSEKGSAMEEAVSNLETASDSIDEIISHIEEAKA